MVVLDCVTWPKEQAGDGLVEYVRIDCIPALKNKKGHALTSVLFCLTPHEKANQYILRQTSPGANPKAL